MNRTYEVMFIVRPDMTEEDQDKLISTLEAAVTSSGGLVKNVEKMGKRRLAYAVRRFHDGMYILLTLKEAADWCMNLSAACALLSR